MAEPFSPGQVVAGKYRIEHELGRGGMAVVYAAWDDTHDRQVAVKVLAPELSGSVGLKRFQDEIRTTAQLDHPNILTLIDSGEANGSLFFVTKLVRGESLRERLRREDRLPLEEALRLGHALASALAHAHGEGVIHRDVKPGNILLDQKGNPYLADFGIARALAVGAGERVTAVGAPIGTPQYMSLEQLFGEEDISAATDIFALGCVLYEMLAGEVPFKGSTREALMGAQVKGRPEPLPEVRDDVPAPVDELIQAALAKEPAERPATADEFAARLDDLRVGVHTGQVLAGPDGTRPKVPEWSPIAYVAGAAAIVGVIAFLVNPGSPVQDEMDTMTYVVLPFEMDSALHEVLPVDLLFQDALNRWDGISASGGLQIREQLSRLEDPSRITLNEAVDVARRSGAGRVVGGRATRIGDSIRVEAELLDAMEGGRSVHDAVVMVAADGVGRDSAIARATDHLLFGPDAILAGGVRLTGTRSVSARRSLGLGLRALTEWNLLEAERRLTESTNSDRDFAQAALWKAQVMSWLNRGVEVWEADARRALQNERALAERERLLASALVAMADGNHPDACASYDELRAQGETDFAAWFGLGECRAKDMLVLPDTSTKTGWSFRGSAHTATQAYRRALESLPSSYRAFGAGGLDLIRSKLYADGRTRGGMGSAPDSTAFMGFPQWEGDSLAFAVLPLQAAMTFAPDESAMSEALIRQRRILLDVATAWERAFPESSDALYTLGAALELIGDGSALEVYGRARALADDPEVWEMIGTAEVTLGLRLSMPANVAGLETAVALADSVLDSGTSARARRAQGLTMLAVLLGRPSLAARFARRSSAGSALTGTPPAVGREVNALLAFAAVGAPLDSIRALEGRAEERIQETLPADQVDETRRNLLGQPALLAFPGHTFGVLASEDFRSPESLAISALVEGDHEGALSAIGPTRPGLTWDVVLPRANVLRESGRGREARDVLTKRFAALPRDDPAAVNSVGRLGGLVRSAALLAVLEQEFGDPSRAAVWSRAVQLLWSGGEDAVQPLVEQMRDILDVGRDR